MVHKKIILITITLLMIGCGKSINKTLDHSYIQNSIKNKEDKLYDTTNFISPPILEYRFDMCSLDQTLKDERNNFDGSIINDPLIVASTLNSALSFNGKDEYIKLPTMDIDYSDGFTFTSWVRFKEYATQGENWETIFSFGNDDSNKAYKDKHKTEIWLNRYYKENKLYFAFTNGDRDDLCGDIKTLNDVIKPKEWQFIAVTIDKQNYPHIFVDGKEVEVEVAWHNRGGVCKLPSVRRDLCYIGKPNDEWMGLDPSGMHRDHKDNNLLNGSIDEVKIFNRALSSSEIKKIYELDRSSKNLDGSTREKLICQTTPKPEPKPTPIPKPKPTPKPTPTPTPAPKPSKIDIKIDAKIDDWVDIDGVSENGTTIKAYTDSEYLYLMLNSTSIKDPKAIWFIDSDNDPKTGYQAFDWSSSGADFAIGQEGILYISKTNDSNFLWDGKSLGEADKFINKNGIIELKVKKSSFKLSNRYRVGVRIDDGTPDSKPFPTKKMLEKEQKEISLDPFDTIKSTLAIKGSTYICIGDSTRADDSHIQNDKVFKIISQKLSPKTTTILQAYPGESLNSWINSSLNDTIDAIPNDGSTTIIDISLGINDARGGATKKNIIDGINYAIKEIRSKKPKTHFVLTMPNKMIGIDSTPYIEAYRELSSSYPMIDTEDLFDESDLSLYRSQDAQEYGSNIRIHLSTKGQELLAKRILKNLI